MQFFQNRRSVRTLALGVASGLLILGPVRLVAQDTTGNIPKTHTVKKGDTLWDLAAKYLADAFRWPELYRLNTDVIQDPHWIYPGEILKLPGYVGVELPSAGAAASNPAPGQVPPSAPPVDTQRTYRPNEPSLFTKTVTPVSTVAAPGQPAPTIVDTTPLPSITPVATVPYGDFIRAPWVERREGPLLWGRIVGSAEIPGIDPARQRARFQLNDRVLIAPPTGSVAPEHELYLAYHYGPLLEEANGQVIIPTGVLEVLRPPRNGDAAVARVVRMFGEVEEHDRLLPYDSSAFAVTTLPVPVKNGIVGDIRWIVDEPVLPPLENFLVLTLTSRDGMKIGDKLELFKPREKSPDVGQPSLPEIRIGTAQVVRVTPLGCTAMITALEQPKVDKGTRVRVIEKMQ
jgi:LysM repeat protein